MSGTIKQAGLTSCLLRTQPEAEGILKVLVHINCAELTLNNETCQRRVGLRATSFLLLLADSLTSAAVAKYTQRLCSALLCESLTSVR